jgi:hypothetical protein
MYPILRQNDDGEVYLVDPTPEEAAAQRREEIQGRLAKIDIASIRPLRAISDGTATEYDRQKLADLEAEAAELRTELAGLG